MTEEHSAPSPAGQGDRLANQLAKADSCLQCGKIREALQYYEEVRRLAAQPGVVAKIWCCLAMLGEFERAWQETDLTERVRRASKENQAQLPLHLRRVWDGGAWEGKNVLVSCYHGLGDTLQFVRYASRLRAQPHRVV